MAAIWKSGETKAGLSSAMIITLSDNRLESLYGKVFGAYLVTLSSLDSRVNLGLITAGVQSVLGGFQGWQFGCMFYTWVFISTCSTLRLFLF